MSWLCANQKMNSIFEVVARKVINNQKENTSPPHHAKQHDIFLGRLQTMVVGNNTIRWNTNPLDAASITHSNVGEVAGVHTINTR
jgi:hypothetical protein